jgi:hypothetical protein
LGNAKDETVKKHIYREGFLYIFSRGKEAVSDAILGIKLRGVKWTQPTRMLTGSKKVPSQ